MRVPCAAPSDKRQFVALRRSSGVHIVSPMTSTTTLRQVLDLYLRGADPHVLTAHERLDVPVRWVHSSEIFEIGPLLSGGELLLTTGLGLTGLDAGTRRHYVRELVERGIAGLAFETGRSFDAVPPEMVQESSVHRLPIIELRRVLPFIEVCRDANTAIVSAELTQLRLRAALDDALHDDLTESAGVSRMLAHLAEVIGRPVVLIGSGGALLAAHGVDDDRSAWRVADGAVAAVSITARGRNLARLYAGAGESGVLGIHAESLMSVAAGPLAAALTRPGTRGSALGARLVEDLVGGKAIRRSDLFARLVGSGVAATDSTVVVPVAAEAPDPRMAEAILTRAASGIVSSTVDATVYALVAVPAASGADDPVEHICAAIASAIDPSERITAVVGDRHRLDESSPGVELALALGESLSRSGGRLAVAIERTGDGRRVFSSRELLVDAVARAAELSLHDELVALLEPLIERDDARSSQLVNTLETHLRNGCSTTRSAQTLHVGRQSLYQRLDRIRALLGFDPTTPAMYPTMLLALSAVRAGNSGG